MAADLRLLAPILTLSLLATSVAGDAAAISVDVTERGLVFVKDLLVERAVRTLTPLRLPDVSRSFRIPLLGVVYAAAANITLRSIDVPSSAIRPGGDGVLITASGAAANLTMDWRFSYRSWILPVEVTDGGHALVQVNGLEVGLTMHIQNKKGSLELNATDCVCSINKISITLDGGSSQFYQGFVNAFQGHIKFVVESTITKKIAEGILKLDSLLKSIPKEIPVDNISALNVTFVDDPLLKNSSVGFDMNGLFIPSKNPELPNYLQNSLESSISCDEPVKMIGISLDELVFNSASVVYFQAGVMHWTVDKVPDQSLLNTASWKYVIPLLYKKYPNDEMQLNLIIISPPIIRIRSQKISATIFSEMTVNVLDAGDTVPVACISVVVSTSGVAKMSRNNLIGNIKLNDFSLKLKWSSVGSFHMSLIQNVMRAFLKTVFMPLVNAHLHKGFPLPIIYGFTIQNADILTSSSKLIVCSDVAYARPNGVL